MTTLLGPVIVQRRPGREEHRQMLESDNGSSSRRAVTIYDVAQRAGVASSTVSRAFSRPGLVSSRTAKRIRRIADEMGYRTDPLARAAASTRTHLIALAIADIGNPFFSEIAIGVQEAATGHGYTMLVVDAQESDRRERAALDRLIPVVDGAIFATYPHVGFRDPGHVQA